MSHLTGFISYPGQTSEVYSTQPIPFGTRGWETTAPENEYVFVDFQKALVAGEWVTFDEAFAATSLVATSFGPCGVVVGVVSASDRFGWVQVRGLHAAALCTSGVTDDSPVAATASTTEGIVSSFTSTKVNLIYGATARSAATTATTTILHAQCSIQLMYPYVLGFLHDAGETT